MRNQRRRAVLGALGLSAVVGAGLVYRAARRDIDAAYRRLARLRRRSFDEACGAMEYAVRGEGYPVLMIHGGAGGFDQGLYLAPLHLDDRFQVIAPSRFGYLGTPMPIGATPKTQADALICLLDELGVDKAAVLAHSAGGPPAVQLALHHPDRVSALMLVSTAISERPLELPPSSVVDPVVSSDFIFWLLTHPLRSLGQRMFVSSSYEPSAEEAAEVAALMRRLLPIKPRAEGLIFDMYVTNMDPILRPSQYPLEEVHVPTLLINAKDDPLTRFEDARAMHRRMPRSELLAVEAGGHTLLGAGDRVRKGGLRFLEAHALSR